MNAQVLNIRENYGAGAAWDDLCVLLRRRMRLEVHWLKQLFHPSETDYVFQSIGIRQRCFRLTSCQRHFPQAPFAPSDSAQAQFVASGKSGQLLLLVCSLKERFLMFFKLLESFFQQTNATSTQKSANMFLSVVSFTGLVSLTF